MKHTLILAAALTLAACAEIEVNAPDAAPAPSGTTAAMSAADFSKRPRRAGVSASFVVAYSLSMPSEVCSASKARLRSASGSLRYCLRAASNKMRSMRGSKRRSIDVKRSATRRLSRS